MLCAESDNVGAPDPIAITRVQKWWGVVAGGDAGYRGCKVGDMDPIRPPISAGNGAIGSVDEAIEGVAVGSADGGDSDD